MALSHFAYLESEDTRSKAQRALAAAALLVAFGALFVFAPADDPTKVVANMPCSILSERDIGSVVGAPVRLMPTSGTICHYVPTGDAGSTAVFVVAHRDATMPVHVPQNGVALRSSGHVYTIVVVPRNPPMAMTNADAQRLAKIVQHPQIANR